jgi:hypothetical protein
VCFAGACYSVCEDGDVEALEEVFDGWRDYAWD